MTYIFDIKDIFNVKIKEYVLKNKRWIKYEFCRYNVKKSPKNVRKKFK